MNEEQAKDKLYYELLYTVREYGGTEADLLKIVDSFSYLDGKSPMFMNPERESYSIEQFLNEQKSNLEKYLEALDIKYNKVIDITGVEYKIFGGKLVIQEGDNYYTLSINVDNSHDITLYKLPFYSMLSIIIDNKYKFQ